MPALRAAPASIPGSHWPDVAPLPQAFTLLTPLDTMSGAFAPKRTGPKTPLACPKRLERTLSYLTCVRGATVKAVAVIVFTMFPFASDW